MSSEYLYQLVEFQLNEQHEAQMKRKFKQQFSHLSFSDLEQQADSKHYKLFEVACGKLFEVVSGKYKSTNNIYVYDQVSATWTQINIQHYTNEHR